VTTASDRYSPQVVGRVREMTRVGNWPADEPGVGTGEAGSLERGTFVRVQIRHVPGDEGVRVVYKVFGCSAAIASASLVAEWVEAGRPLRPEAVAAALELPPDRAHVAALAVDAAERALAAWHRANGREAAE
jgi:NifU-like protein involved in Fe-S cluster formation